jgi:hypothetical protein
MFDLDFCHCCEALRVDIRGLPRYIPLTNPPSSTDDCKTAAKSPISICLLGVIYLYPNSNHPVYLPHRVIMALRLNRQTAVDPASQNGEDYDKLQMLRAESMRSKRIRDKSLP